MVPPRAPSFFACTHARVCAPAGQSPAPRSNLTDRAIGLPPPRLAPCRLTPCASSRTHHLHLVVPGSQAWREELAFRDALRAEPDTAAAYEELKRRLADEHLHDREAYTVAKTEFVEAVLARVL